MTDETRRLDTPARREARTLPPEWYELWMERAAIMEYDGKMTPENADTEALWDIRSQMRRQAAGRAGQ